MRVTLWCGSIFVALFAGCLFACHGGAQVAATDAAPTSTAAPDLSACVKLVADHQRTVQAHLEAARVKMSTRDGKGCITELDAYDAADPWTGSATTSPTNALAMMRAQCMMLAGDCSPGKDLFRAALTSSSATLGPEMVDKSVDAIASMYCSGNAIAPRDELLRALMDLNQGAYMTTKDVPFCHEAYDAALRLIPQVPPKDTDDTTIKQASAQLRITAPQCFARAGDCAQAWRAFHDQWLTVPGMTDAVMHKTFDNLVRRCSDP